MFAHHLQAASPQILQAGRGGKGGRWGNKCACLEGTGHSPQEVGIPGISQLPLCFAASLKDGVVSTGSSQDNDYLLDIMTDISLAQS